MSITIVATVGSATANSFVTETEFAAYAATRLNILAGTTVSGSSCTEAEKKALIEATREVSGVTYRGNQTDDAQALSWPRINVVNPDASSSYTEYDDDVIPQRVKDAACEYALEFLKAGTTDIAVPASTDGVISKTVGPLSTTYADPSKRRSGVSRYPRVLQRLSPLLGIGSGQVRLVR